MRFFINILVFSVVLHAGAPHVWAQSDDCELKRKAFIHTFGGKHDYDAVLKNSEFKKLCTNDQNKLNKIIHSTVRVFLLAEPEDPSDINSDKDYQPIEDDNNETTGTILEQSRIMIALPHHGSFTSDPWKTTKPFRIRVVNFEGHEAVLMVKSNKIIRMGLMNSIALLQLNKSLDSVNPYFGYNFISNFNGEIIQDYTNFAIDKEKMTPNPFLFYLAYERDKDVWFKKKLKIGFGADQCFYDDNIHKKGKLHAGSSHWISAYNQGGGVYNYNLILVGIDQGVIAYPNTSELTEYFDVVPKELFK